MELRERLRNVLGIELQQLAAVTAPAPVQDVPSAPVPPAPVQDVPSVLVKVVPFSLPVKSMPGDKNRLRMIKRVEMRWLPVLKSSLYKRTLILLSLKELSTAVKNPWSEVVQETSLSGASLPLVGSHISEVYDEADGELLILGEPGAGKTILLLELARTLIERTRYDERQPFPVVFNLSEWSSHKQQSLQNWLVEELNSKYQVPRKLGLAWLEEEKLLPLLDGLDEVDLAERENCIEAINDFREVYGLLPMVLCCRSGDYFAQPARLLLNRAIEVQPLTVQQIDEYIKQVGPDLEALRLALQEDAELRDVASTPLMLSTLIVAYQGLSKVLVTGSPTQRRALVFARYVERALERRGVKRISIEQVRRYLGWLALQMYQRNKTEFYVERLQPDWLQNDRQQYQKNVTRLIAIIQCMLCGSLAAWLKGG